MDVLEEKIRILEGAQAATSFSSGMAAISNTLFAHLKSGDRVVASKDTYGGTSKIFIEFLPKYGIKVKLCDTTNHHQIEKEVAKGCQLLYLETPTNPTLKIQDILVSLSEASRRAIRWRDLYSRHSISTEEK